MRRRLPFKSQACAVAVLGACLATPADAASIPVTGSIASAIAAAQPGDTLELAGPAVFAEKVVINKPLRIVGVNSPVLDGGGAGTCVTIAASDVEIRGCTMRNSGKDL